jgi:di/tricarboxylate transporter
MYNIFMTPEIITVLIILLIAILLFVTERLRVDLIALLVLVSLALTGLVTPVEALSGFSNPAVVTVWAVLILSGALSRTGVASLIGSRMLRLVGTGEVKILLAIMLTAGVLSGFMNSIGVASLFLPVVIDIARSTRRPPSKLLMPLATAALLGGLLTLIGTPSNILISDALIAAGLQPFGMFDFTPIGLVILLAGVIFVISIGRHLLPARDIAKEFARIDSKDLYGLQERMRMITIPRDSALVGKSLIDSRFGVALGLNVIAILRGSRTQLAPGPEEILKSGDRLLVEGKLDRLNEYLTSDQLIVEESDLTIERLASSEIELVEFQLAPNSPLVGTTLRKINLRRRFGVIVLAIHREGEIMRTRLERITLQSGDSLLAQGTRSQLDSLKTFDPKVDFEPLSTEIYDLERRLMMLRVLPHSPLAGKTLIESRLGEAFDLGVMGIIRDGELSLMPDPDHPLLAGDLLLVKGKREDLLTVQGLQNLQVDAQELPDLDVLESESVGIVEAMLSPHTTLVGKTLQELHIRAKYGLNILAIWRQGRAYRSNLGEMALRLGDALLLYGPRQKLRVLGSDPDFLVLTESAQEAPRLKKAPLALLIMAAVLVPVILGWLNIAIAAIAGVVLMVLTGCISMDEAYRSIQLNAIFLIAGMLPLGIALENTGAARLIAESMVNGVGQFGSLAVMAGLFLLTALASQVMPNPAVAVLIAPIALNTAANMNISPQALMMAVAISASAAFLSPIGHPANLLVMGPGGYKLSDYIKVGLPLTFVVLVIVLLVLPIFWPL